MLVLGVDLADWKTQKYNWYFSLDCLDVAVVNCHILYYPDFSVHNNRLLKTDFKTQEAWCQGRLPQPLNLIGENSKQRMQGVQEKSMWTVQPWISCTAYHSNTNM